MSPKRTNLILPSHVPDSEANVLIFHSFNVEAYTGKMLVYEELAERELYQ